MRIIKFILPLLLFGCGPVYERGNGNLSSVQHQVDNFSEIRVDGVFEIILQEGDEKVTVLTDENLHQYINIFADGDVLFVESIQPIRSKDGIKVYINYEHLEVLELRGAPQVSAEGRIRSREFIIELEGAAIAELELEVRELELEISGAGLIELSGEARRMIVDMSGTGNLNAYELECQTARIDLSGVGAAQVNVREKLSGSVSGVGSITYKGNPEIVESDIGGLGQIRPARKDDKSGIEIDI